MLTTFGSVSFNITAIMEAFNFAGVYHAGVEQQSPSPTCGFASSKHYWSAQHLRSPVKYLLSPVQLATALTRSDFASNTRIDAYLWCSTPMCFPDDKILCSQCLLKPQCCSLHLTTLMTTSSVQGRSVSPGISVAACSSSATALHAPGHEERSHPSPSATPGRVPPAPLIRRPLVDPLVVHSVVVVGERGNNAVRQRRRSALLVLVHRVQAAQPLLRA